MSKWIKTQDRVMVLSGNDKGKIGKVIARKEQRVVVEGVNIRKKHMKRRSQNQPAQQIINIEMPIHISNVKIVDDKDNPIKLKVRENSGKKELVYVSQGKEIVYRTIKSNKR